MYYHDDLAVINGRFSHYSGEKLFSLRSAVVLACCPVFFLFFLPMVSMLHFDSIMPVDVDMA